jgi:hypothetical protein
MAANTRLRAKVWVSRTWAVGHLFRVADLLQFRANAAIEDDHPAGPQSLVNAAIGRSHAARGRLHGTSLLDGDPLFTPEPGSSKGHGIRPVIPQAEPHPPGVRGEEQ